MTSSATGLVFKVLHPCEPCFPGELGLEQRLQRREDGEGISGGETVGQRSRGGGTCGLLVEVYSLWEWEGIQPWGGSYLGDHLAAGWFL